MNQNDSFPCPICFWEDDFVQLGSPLAAVGANKVSLYEAQCEFMRNGVSEYRFISHVRLPTNADLRDPQWRLFDPEGDPYLRWDSEVDSKCWRAGLEEERCLYYWRDDYWLLKRKKD